MIKFKTTSAPQNMGMVWVYANDIPVAYAIVSTTDEKEVSIWLIYTETQFRRKGYAKAFLERMKGYASSIVSGATTDSAKKLFKACGFQFVNQGHALSNYWEWKKV